MVDNFRLTLSETDIYAAWQLIWAVFFPTTTLISFTTVSIIVIVVRNIILNNYLRSRALSASMTLFPPLTIWNIGRIRRILENIDLTYIVGANFWFLSRENLIT